MLLGPSDSTGCSRSPCPLTRRRPRDDRKLPGVGKPPKCGAWSPRRKVCSAPRGAGVGPTEGASNPTAAAEAGSQSGSEIGACSEREAEEVMFSRSLRQTVVEMEACLRLVQLAGHGFVYLGSSRVPEDHNFFRQSRELSRQVALRFGSTTWSGIGPGLMEAVCQGAAMAGTKAAGFKVVLEATQGPAHSYQHPYLPREDYLICRSLLARKQGLVWAGSRGRAADRAGFVVLPGGVGTLDELLDLLAVRQLNLNPPRHKVPLLVLNYDGCYDSLLSCLKDMERCHLVRDGELDPLWSVCQSNEEALDCLDNFFSGMKDEV